ncbi:MAG: NifU family protein [Candidatus Omnitrophota bacterium]
MTPEKETNTEFEKISAIIDQHIRPALQMHGGDLQLVDFKDNVLTINYKGACGSCPGATMGTLYAIQSVLQEQYDPKIVVKIA